MHQTRTIPIVFIFIAFSFQLGYSTNSSKTDVSDSLTIPSVVTEINPPTGGKTTTPPTNPTTPATATTPVITTTTPVTTTTKPSTTPSPSPPTSSPTTPTTTSSTSTTTTTTTPSPNTTTKVSTTTVRPAPPTTPFPSHRRFDGPSFIGGIVLALGLVAIGFVAFKFYKARTELNYHTL